MQTLKFLVAFAVPFVAGFGTAEARTRHTSGWIGLASLSFIATVIALLWLADHHDESGGRVG